MDPSQNPNVFHATTIVSVRRGEQVVIAGDGQVTLGHTVMKSNARKVRRLGENGQVLAGFAGAAADAFTLFELFEAKLQKHGQLTRAAVEMAKDWRTERRFGKLEALLAVADRETSLVISGTGDVIEPEDGLIPLRVQYPNAGRGATIRPILRSQAISHAKPGRRQGITAGLRPGDAQCGIADQRCPVRTIPTA